MLRIQPLRAPRDENIYECVAENSEAEINVNAKLSIIRGEPISARPSRYIPFAFADAFVPTDKAHRGLIGRSHDSLAVVKAQELFVCATRYTVRQQFRTSNVVLGRKSVTIRK